MAFNGKKALIVIVNRLWFGLALFLVTVAVVVSMGRWAIGELDEYRPLVNQFISEALGSRFESGRLVGSWEKLEPSIRAIDAKLFDKSGSEPVLTLSDLRLKPDLVESVIHGELVWKELSVARLDLTLAESEDGQWRVLGFPATDDADDSKKDFGSLLAGSHFSVDELKINIQFYSGTHTSLMARDMLLERSGDFYRIAATLGAAGGKESAQLLLETRGEVGDLSSFKGKGFLTLSSINFHGNMSAIVKNWFPDLVEKIGDVETELQASLWFDIKNIGDIQMVGQISAAEIPLNWLADAEPFTDFHADITGWFRIGDSWGVRWQAADFNWDELSIEPFNLVYSQQTGDKWGYGSIALERVNLQNYTTLALKTRLIPDKVLTLLEALNPKGHMRGVHMTFSPGQERPNFSLRANLASVEIGSFKGSPAASGVSGYLQADNDTGLVELDADNGFAMLFPKSYDDYMTHSRAKGQLRWLIDRSAQRLKLSSGLIEVGGGPGEGEGRIYLHLDGSLAGKKDGEMYLLAGMRDMEARYRNRYLPKVLKKNLRDWLDLAPGDHLLEEVGFIWRGSFSPDSDDRTMQLFINASGGDLQFHPDWLPLQDLAASVIVDDGRTSGSLRSGQIGGISLGNGSFAVDRQSDSDNLMLNLQVQGLGDARDIYSLLESSPLGQRMSALDNWQISGATSLDVDLAIPLKEGAGGGRYLVDIGLDGVDLGLRKGNLAFNDLTGSIEYNSQRGISGTGLKGSLWDKPLQATIQTKEGSGGQQLMVEAAGVVSADRLSEMLGIEELNILSGATDFKALLALPLGAPAGRTSRLSLDSQLKGVAIQLPAPFGVEKGKKLKLSTDIFFAETLIIRQQLGPELNAIFEVGDGSLKRGAVFVGGGDPELPAENSLLVKGQLQNFSLADWQPVFQSVQGMKPSTATATPGPGLRPSLDLAFARLELGSYVLADAIVKGGYEESRWRFSVTSDIAEGEVSVDPSAEVPLSLGLKRLSLPASEEKADLAGFDPATLPAVQFSVDDLSVGDLHYGSAAFTLVPQQNGALFRDIHTNQRGLQVGGKRDDTVETQLLWTLENGRHRTHFDGLVRAGDLGDVLESWGMQRILDSKRAIFLADLVWTDHPMNVNGENLTGSLAIDLKDGRFYREPKGATNALIRLVGLINFSTWVRLLKLDFSDFLEEGLSYDSLSGGLYFNRGTMSFDPPMVVSMSVGKIQLAGEADLLSEEIDARLITTLPVGTNLPWLAALVGGLPAAAGVYLTSKIFEKQVDQLSSIAYTVEGPWQDTEIKVDKIFSDKLKRSRPSGSEE